MMRDLSESNMRGGARARLFWRAVSSLVCALFVMACGELIGIPHREVATVDAGADAAQVDASGLGDTADAADAESQSSALSALTTSSGALNPAFSPTTFEYSVRVSDLFGTLSFTVTAAAASLNATITIDQKPTASGVASPPFPLALVQTKRIPIVVRSARGVEQTYAITVTNAPAYTYVKPSNKTAHGAFGSVLAFSGDTLVVGEPEEESGATGINGNQNDASAPASGAVYVFTRSSVDSGVEWKQEAYLKASNSREYSWFGEHLALSGDTLVVGAHGESSGAKGVNGDQSDTSVAGSGAAYVFVRANGAWTQQAYLKASNTRTNCGFGGSLALDGDTLAVGAWQESSGAGGINADQTDASAPNSGAVYVFRRTGVTWAQEAYIKASNAPYQKWSFSNTAPYFGYSVALRGDTLAVGAYGESSNAKGVGGSQTNTSATSSGAAYVFTRAGATWTQQAYLKASNTSTNSEFGSSIALYGDTLAVGAPYERSFAKGINGDESDNGANSAGAVYVFSRAGGTWAQEAYVKASNTSELSVFGTSVALSSDRLVVGAPGEPSHATFINGDQGNASAAKAGAAYVFVRGATAWEERAYVKASNAREQSWFGNALAFDGGTLVVAAYKESGGATGINGNQLDMTNSEAGAVYILE
jgi:hypothetical protein